MRIEIENETKLKEPIVTLRLVQSGTSINSINGNSVLLQGSIDKTSKKDWFNILVIDEEGFKRPCNESIKILGFVMNGVHQVIMKL